MSSSRPPHVLTPRLGPESSDAALRYEFMEAQANSLGRAGKKVETTLAALREHPGGEGRIELLRAAADAVWAFLVQREAMGLRDRAYIVAHYGVPREVLNRLGAR